MKTTIQTLFILLLSISLSSCFFEGEVGNGNVVTTQRNVSSDFIGINSSAGINVILKSGDKTSVKVESDENLQDLILTKVENGVLKITSKKNIWKASAKNVYVVANNLNNLQASSGSVIRSDEILGTKDLHLEASSGAVINLNVNVSELRTEASSGASIKLVGKSEMMHASVSSGANINAFDLETTNCDAEASSGGNVKVNVHEKLSSSSSSGGSITRKEHNQVF